MKYCSHIANCFHNKHPINKSFLNIPLQSIQFDLAGIRIENKKLFKQEFDKLIGEYKNFRACVFEADTDRLQLYLFHEKISPTSLNKIMVVKGFATNV